jgi:hypothetical protein
MERKTLKRCEKRSSYLIYFLVSLFLSLVCFVDSANAAPVIRSIEMNVFISQNGEAHIEEIWQVEINEGTEGYKPYGDLGSCEIKDFTVSDDSGRVYDYVNSWNVSGDFASKRYKNGIVKKARSVELCWGISEYGSRTYILNYTITNFVNQYSDAQGVYFSLMPREMDQSPRSVIITISSDYGSFNEETAKIWGFGYTGQVVFQDGNIVMNSNGSLSSSQYMVLLVKFEKDYFDTGSHVSASFSDVLQQAMVGSDYSDSSSYSDYPDYSNYLKLLYTGKNAALVMIASVVFLLFPWIVIGIIIVAVSRSLKANAHAKAHNYHFGTAGNKLPPFKEAQYWREIPCNKDLEIAYWASLNYSVSSESEVKTGVIGSFLLKWLQNGNIDIIKLPKKHLPFGKDDNYALAFLSPPRGYKSETRLAEFMKEAKGKNDALQPKQFQKWCENNYTRMQSWYESLENYGTNALERSGLLVRETVPLPDLKVLGLTLAKNRSKTVNNVQPFMKEEAIRMQGLKKFLLEFSLISEKTVYEVRLWEEYLIFAQLLGIADKVREQLRKVYPEFSRISQLDSRINNADLFLGSFAVSGYSGMRSGASRASSSSGSGGGGGSSSSGGGGGAGGSSSGGGFR